jgi:UDP-glucose 4-epimerase
MILIVGGAGYIGSHINKELTKQGYKTVIFDSLVKGHKEAVKWGEFYDGDLNNIEDIRGVFKQYKIEAVLHFAAFIEVGESVKDPQKYYQNNVVNTLSLFKVMLENEVKKIIFSSTAATFGNPEYTPIDEKHPQVPINPYGQAKLVVEKILRDYDTAYGMKYIALRYFNACGADLETEIGENHIPESHLIPLILDAAAGKREDIKIFGSDYPTPDGTCVRDYVHVVDLAQAHILALKRLIDGGESDAFNLGNGKGFSVKEVIEAAKKITGIDFKVTMAERRAGDPPTLVADSKKAKEVLGWQPQYADLETIIGSAWKWHQKMNETSK